ncbi:MAG: class I SAM-dependent methyltransferase [Burkholderiaceae bacterium]|jgi:SAM-dependent methyltransferase|nr:class I SAM-dependent methyltransferase [Burkholderiaceae bacterium]
MPLEDESPAFWQPFEHDDLATRCAVLHAERRQREGALAETEVQAVRRTLAHVFLHGEGVEVGAGSRPFPLPPQARCRYGDIRDQAQLASYFGTEQVSVEGRIDAQTMAGVAAASLDFVISAHVIEHLYDPIGALRASVQVLRPGGILLLAVPEMTRTWDCRRSPTTLAHLLCDNLHGGEGTRLQAYVEHVRHVHPQITGQAIPEDEVIGHARAIMAAGMDLHVHAWREADFRELLDYLAPRAGFVIEVALSVQNENLYVLRRGVVAS